MGNIMVSLKKFISNKNTVTILGVLLGLFVLYFGYTWRVNQSTNPVSIPYCLSTLTAKSRITADNIGIVSVPAELVQNWQNIVRDQGFLTDAKLVSFDSKIAANSFFFKENIIEESKMPDSVFSDIPTNYTIYALGVTLEKTYANSIFPGDMIDLYVYTKDPNDGKVVYGRFIKSIEVLAVRDGSGQNVFDDKDNLKPPSQLLFAVPEEYFLLLKKAEKIGGFEIEPVPRNDSYTTHASETQIVNNEIRDMIVVQSYQFQNECIDLDNCVS